MPSNEKAPPIRKRLVFYGRVQRVGFRYELIRMAKRYHLVGWVKNKKDATVEAEIQGPEEDIRLLVAHMRSLKRARITKLESSQLPPLRGEQDFIVIW